MVRDQLSPQELAAAAMKQLPGTKLKEIENSKPKQPNKVQHWMRLYVFMLTL